MKTLKNNGGHCLSIIKYKRVISIRRLTKEQTNIINEQLSKAQAVHVKQDGSITIREGNTIKPLSDHIGSYFFLRYLKPLDFEAAHIECQEYNEKQSALLQFCTKKIQGLESLTKEQDESLNSILDKARYVLIEHDGKVTIKDHEGCFICIYKKEESNLNTEFSHIQTIKDLPDLLENLVNQIEQQEVRIKSLEAQLYVSRR